MFGPKHTIHTFICKSKIYIWNFNLEMFGTLGPGEMNHEKQFPNPKLASWTWNLNEQGVWKWITHTCSLLFMTTGILVRTHFCNTMMITNYNQFTCKFTFKSTDLFLEPPQPPSVSEKSRPSLVEHGVEGRHRVFEQILRPLDFQHDVLIARLPWRFFTPHPTHLWLVGCKVTHGVFW